jgi:hypothetical protein
MPIRGSPNGARHSGPQGWSRSPGMGGRDQSERLVAINRNSWSRSPGARKQESPGFLIDRALNWSRSPLGGNWEAPSEKQLPAAVLFPGAHKRKPAAPLRIAKHTLTPPHRSPTRFWQ